MIFNSGWILEANWNKGTLEIKFNSLSIWRYKRVPKRVWDEFKVVSDRANYFLMFVKDKYESQCIHQEPALFETGSLQKKAPKA